MNDFKKLKDNYINWYTSPAVKFNLIKFTYNKEFGLISKFMPGKSARTFRVHSVQHFDMVMDATWSFKNNALSNMFTTVATYALGVPIFSLDLRRRDTGDWKETSYKHIVDYPFFIDIDAPTHNYMKGAQNSALSIMSFLDDLKCPYELRFSGKGFHFLIPEYKDFKGADKYNAFSDDNIYSFYKNIAESLHDRFSEFIDTDIYDSRRLIKLPYSLVSYETGEQYIAMPLLSRLELLDFKIERYAPELWRASDLRVRGNKIFNSDGDVNQFYEVFK